MHTSFIIKKIVCIFTQLLQIDPGHDVKDENKGKACGGSDREGGLNRSKVSNDERTTHSKYRPQLQERSVWRDSERKEEYPEIVINLHFT
jgi:hypothetical protein